MKTNTRAKDPLSPLAKLAKNDELDQLEQFSDILEGGMECCGLKELDGISNFDRPATAVLAMCFQLSGSDTSELQTLSARQLRFAHLIFSQAGPRAQYGIKLAQFIIENGLGHIAGSIPAVNPNTKNSITAFIWTPNKRALMAWWNKQVEPANKAIHDQTHRENGHEDEDDNDYAYGM